MDSMRNVASGPPHWRPAEAAIRQRASPNPLALLDFCEPGRPYADPHRVTGQFLRESVARRRLTARAEVLWTRATLGAAPRAGHPVKA